MSVILCYGKGQLGNSMRALLEQNTFQNVDYECYVYHTWNVDDKGKEAQSLEFEKFVKFVDSHKESKIILVSTYSTQENWYNHYKHKSEAYLSLNCDRGFSVRLPTIVGKGIVSNLKRGTSLPFGTMELITLQDAATAVLNFLKYDGIVKVFTVPGEKISATLVTAILRDV